MRAPAISFVLAALTFMGLAVPPVSAAPPQRVVSLNVCSDQLLMLLAAPERIAAVSYLATDPEVSALAAEARGLTSTSGRLEEVLELQPDLVLVGSFTTRPTVFALRRLGIPVVELSPARSFAEIRANLRQVGAALSTSERAERLIADFDETLTAVTQAQKGRAESDRPRVAVYGVNGWSAGPGSLRHAVLEAAGLENLAGEALIGTRSHLPLEVLIGTRPELIVTSQREPQAPALAEALLRHPAFLELRGRSSLVAIPQALWTCGTPLIAKAVTRLADGTRGARFTDRPPEPAP
ncbi:ABC transporter substrate-binding protein [Algihabitans albus]|uniref:ABC transporter substrate-binding protein n=1 Tax=Algihabitans albus TaxID=2164067 RepID=UPI000E5D589B|nr:ABC transporter substrate-binding protein [Algihabitans albus]